MNKYIFSRVLLGTLVIFVIAVLGEMLVARGVSVWLGYALVLWWIYCFATRNRHKFKGKMGKVRE